MKVCRRCHTDKEFEDFAPRRAVCKQCYVTYHREWRQNRYHIDPEYAIKLCASNKAYRLKNKRKIKERQKLWYTKMASTAEGRQKLQKYGKDKRQRTRRRFIEKYGGKCACCGETNEGFLSLDHVNSDGHIERKRNTRSYNQALLSILENLPPDPRYQILCYNCNMGRQFHGDGVCPHIGEK